MAESTVWQSKKLQEHLAKEHKMSPFSTYLKEIVYGGTDGIVTTFAVVAGFTGAQSSALGLPLAAVALFGLANLFADGASMGLSNFLSMKAEQDVYNTERAKETHEVQKNPEDEKAETIDILISKGFTKDRAEKITELYATNPAYWTDFMMNYELELPDPHTENPFITGFATFSSFVAFGFIPLIPYVFKGPSQNLFEISIMFTAFALLALGLLRWRVTKQTIVRSVGEIMALGGISASIAYLVGTFFRG